MSDEKVTIPEKGFVRLPQILAVIPIGASSWWAGIREGKYPAPVRPSPFGRATVWRAEDINAFIQKAASGQLPRTPHKVKRARHGAPPPVGILDSDED